MVGTMNQLRPRNFDAVALVSTSVVFGFGSCVMECANGSHQRVGARDVVLQNRLDRRLRCMRLLFAFFQCHIYESNGVVAEIDDTELNRSGGQIAFCGWVRIASPDAAHFINGMTDTKWNIRAY